MDTSGSGRRRHRSWPETLKREIVAASFEPGSSVSLVARRYDLNTNQLFSWRKIYRDGLLAGPALVPVTVAAEPARETAPPQSVMDTSRLRCRVDIASVSVLLLMRRRCGAFSTCWRADDPVRGSGLVGSRSDRHAQRHERAGAAGAAGSGARSACR